MKVHPYNLRGTIDRAWMLPKRRKYKEAELMMMIYTLFLVALGV